MSGRMISCPRLPRESNVMDYSLPSPDSIGEIGRRARRLRDLLGMTAEQVAAEASVSTEDVLALETGMAVHLDVALAIHDVLSSDAVGEAFFTRPKLRNINEVEAFERRRLGR